MKLVFDSWQQYDVIGVEHSLDANNDPIDIRIIAHKEVLEEIRDTHSYGDFKMSPIPAYFKDDTSKVLEIWEAVYCALDPFKVVNFLGVVSYH